MPLNSIVIPDTSHAYFLDQTCRLNPLITLPDPATSAAVASTGGRFPAPVGGGLPVTPALVGPPPTNPTLIDIPPQTTSELMRVMRGATTAEIFTAAAVRATLIGGVVVIADLGLEVYKAMQRTGLSATQVIRLATETPDGPYEHHLDPKLRPITERAKYLSSLVVDGRNMGSCEKKTIEPMIDWMKQWCDGAKACTVPPPLDPLEQKERLNRLKMCLKYRIEIMDECFDGGDDRHRSEASDVLKRYRTCQGIKAYVP